MKAGVIALAGTLVLGLGGAWADTLVLDTGVQCDGVVKELPDGNYSVNAGGRTLIYRKAEVVSIEKNAKTGALDLEAVKAQWAQHDKELTEKTGLNAQQRQEVDKWLAALVGADERKILSIRDTLASMQKEMDVFRYIEFAYWDMSHLMAPIGLDILFFLDPARALVALRRSAEHPYYAVRQKALELLGRAHDRESITLIARGMLDGNIEVRIMAAYALANAGGKEATPLLIDALKHPDMRVGNSSRESLEALWKADLPDPKPRTVDAWTAFFNSHNTGLPPALTVEGLEPLIPPDQEFQNE